MNFQPKSAKELQEAQLWPDGEYDFEVIKSERAVSGQQSKNPGTPYIKLSIVIFNADGAKKFINGILHPAMEWALRQFCEVTGILDKYEAGSLEAEDCQGLCGKLQLKTKEAEGNFPAKNEVKSWGAKKEKGAAKKDKPAPAKRPHVNGSNDPRLQVPDTGDGDPMPF